LLTHGHFDHVGSLRDLADFWNVPVYAHAMERPYLTGASKYPPPDPSVGGGAMAWMAGLYPRGPIDIGDRLRNLPADNTVPGLEGWRWIPTPGHSPGHVSFFRDEDRVLIAGDAFVTTKQESMMAVIEQRPEMHGPPAYFTPDWDAARLSVGRLAALQPAVVATGHGVPMVGPRMEDALDFLAENFDDIARPTHGRYVRRPATMDERGVVTLPPPSADPLRMTMLGVAAAIAITFAIKRSRS
jgi:glyoxylase-like metal-dependent hydrolase (beta-lactamase superfamily II)